MNHKKTKMQDRTDLDQRIAEQQVFQERMKRLSDDQVRSIIKKWGIIPLILKKGNLYHVDIEKILQKPNTPLNETNIELTTPCDMKNLGELTKIDTYHFSGSGVFFKPDTREILSQIPPYLFGLLKGFAVTYFDSSVLYQSQFHSKYGVHKATTTLYFESKNGISPLKTVVQREFSEIFNLLGYQSEAWKLTPH